MGCVAVGDVPRSDPKPRRPNPNGHDAASHRATKRRADHRLAARDKSDEALLAAMKADPDPKGQLAHRPVAQLDYLLPPPAARRRFSRMGRGQWRQVEEPPPREPPPKWVERRPSRPIVSGDGLITLPCRPLAREGSTPEDIFSCVCHYPTGDDPMPPLCSGFANWRNFDSLIDR